MIDQYAVGLCLEGFLYGIISILRALTFTLAKEVQLFFGLGLYSGIFAIYLQCPLKESRTAIIIFYVLCLLYVLSTATVVCDLINPVISMRFSSLSPQLQIDSLTLIFRLGNVITTLYGCCDFIAQFILIYRCWIVWGKNIYVVIIPSFLAIAYMATWLAGDGATTVAQGQILTASWGNTLILTGLAASMAVNTLVTGLILFKICTVFLEVKATSIERTLGPLSSTGDNKLQHIIFVIIESAMALFAIQLVRVVLTCLVASQETEPGTFTSVANALNLVIGAHEMLNGIAPTIILVRVSMKLSFNDEESFKEAVESLRFNNPPSDSDTLALQRRGSSNSIMISSRSQERNEDYCFDNSPSDSNTI